MRVVLLLSLSLSLILFTSVSLYYTHREMRNMTEIELELMLLRYNVLSKERATAAYMCEHTDADEYRHYENEWTDCTIEMVWMRDDLRKCGYRFAFTGYKTTGEVKYEVYRIVPIDNQ